MKNEYRKPFDNILFLTALGLIFLAAFGLELTDWVPGLNRVTASALIGLILGMLLKHSVFIRKIKISIFLLYSINILSLLLIFSFNTHLTWQERLWELYGIIRANVFALEKGIIVEHNVLFMIGMSLFYWITGIVLGYYLEDQHYWKPLSLLSIAFIIQQLFVSPGNRNAVLEISFFVLLFFLVARHEYVHSVARWQLKDFSYDEDIWKSSVLRISLTIMGIAILAWNVPIIIRSFVPGTQESRALGERVQNVSISIQNFFGGFKQTATSSNAEFGNYLSVDARQPVSEEIQYIFTLDKPLDYSGRLYWRTRTYDLYNSPYWEDTISKTQSVLAGDNIPRRNEDIGDFVTIFVEKTLPKVSLPFPGILLEINRDAEILYSDSEQGEYEVTALKDLARNNDPAQIKVSIPMLDIETLRGVHEIDRTLVDKKYTEIDPIIKDKIFSLVADFPAKHENVFDLIQNVTNYLRMNYSYSTDQLPVMTDTDPVVDFLFHSKKGFCNQFASAEVLLLRSLGIPARLSVGYAEGEYVDSRMQFIVREKDLHAWPEAFIEGVGWVIFEPTPAYPSLITQSAYNSENDGRDDFSQFTQELNASSLNSAEISSEAFRFSRVEELFNTEGVGVERELIELPKLSSPKKSLRINILLWLVLFVCFVLLIFLWQIFHLPSVPMIIHKLLGILGKKTPVLVLFWKKWLELNGWQRDYFVLESLLFISYRSKPLPVTLQKTEEYLLGILPEISEPIKHLFENLEAMMYNRKKVDSLKLRKMIKNISFFALRKLVKIKIDHLRDHFL